MHQAMCCPALPCHAMPASLPGSLQSRAINYRLDRLSHVPTRASTHLRLLSKQVGLPASPVGTALPAPTPLASRRRRRRTRRFQFQRLATSPHATTLAKRVPPMPCHAPIAAPCRQRRAAPGIEGTRFSLPSRGEAEVASAVLVLARRSGAVRCSRTPVGKPFHGPGASRETACRFGRGKCALDLTEQAECLPRRL